MRRRHYASGPGHRRRGGFFRREPVPLLMYPESEFPILGALFRGLGGLSRAGWRYRSELAPLTLALAVFVAGGWVHARYSTWWWPVGLVTVTLTAAVAVCPLSTWVKRPAWLLRRSERLYGAFAVAACGGWLSAAAYAGPSSRPLPTLAVVLVAVGGLPWWIHRRRRARVRVERTITAWPTIAETVGLPGSRITSAVVTAWGWTARVTLQAGHTVAGAIDRIPAIESGLHIRPGSVRINSDPQRADRIVMRVIERDPHAEPIDYPTPEKPSITKPAELGVFEDGTPVRVSFLRRHALIGGIAGSGKSGVLNVILGFLTRCPDVVVWGADLKGGMELAPWKTRLGKLATEPETVTAMLAEAVAVLEDRAHDMAGMGLRVWEPTPDSPALVIVIDEYAELPDAAREYADSIARRGRAVAVTLLVATQRPTQEAMGNGAVRSQMDIRICLRVRERRDTDLILGQGMHSAGWFSETLDQPGKFLVSSTEYTAPYRARAYLVTDEKVTELATTNTQPLAAIPVPDRTDTENTETPTVFIPSPRVSPENDPNTPEYRLWKALREASEDGISIEELIAATGMSRPWVYRRLTEHQHAGRAGSVARGRYRATPNPGADR